MCLSVRDIVFQSASTILHIIVSSCILAAAAYGTRCCSSMLSLADCVLLTSPQMNNQPTFPCLLDMLVGIFALLFPAVSRLLDKLEGALGVLFLALVAVVSYVRLCTISSR